MADQPSYRPLEPSSFFLDGLSARPPVPGTVARGTRLGPARRLTGKEGDRDAEQFPLPITRRVLERGRERYTIYCAVCHDAAGMGKGPIVARGYTPPPSYHIRALREAAVGHYFDVITHGYGSMPSYEAELPPDDRWAIIAYIRALQLSRHVPLADLPAAEREHFGSGEGP